MFLKHQKFTKVKQKTKQNKEEGKIVKLCPQESSEEIWGLLIKQRIHKKQDKKKKTRVSKGQKLDYRSSAEFETNQYQTTMTTRQNGQGKLL